MPTNSLSPKSLVNSLKPVAKRFQGLTKLKVLYRPMICPLHTILSEIPEGASCFDIGCGSGTLLWLIQNHRSPSSLAGVEISESLVNEAHLLVPEFANNIQVYNGTQLPESIGNYDFVVMNDVFHHIPPVNQVDFLKNLKKKMKPGSRFIFKDIDADRRILVYANKLHDLLLAGELGNEISMSRTEEMLIEAGFSIEKKEYERMLWYPHFTIIAKA